MVTLLCCGYINCVGSDEEKGGLMITQTYILARFVYAANAVQYFVRFFSIVLHRLDCYLYVIGRLRF